MTLEIQRGQPSSEQAHHYASLAQIAGDGFFSTLYGSNWKTILEKLYLSENVTANFLRTHFVWKDDTIVGALTGYSHEDYRKLNDSTEKLLIEYLGTARFQFYLVYLFLRAYGINFSKPNENEYYIETIATYPEYRRQGIGTTLLQTAEKIALAQRCQTLCLDVDKKNTGAIRSYEKFGFSKQKSNFYAKLVRMEKTLNSQ